TSVITLIATANGGCADTTARTITVHPLPQANFLSTDACFGSSIPFFDQSSVVSGDSITNYSWIFPGGSPATSVVRNPSVIFNQLDTIDVMLVVTNAGGCRDTAVRSVRITANPTAAFSASSSCLGIRPSIINNSSIRPSGSQMYYQWSFSGGAPGMSNDRDPVVDYISPGSSLINLIVSADGGCADTLDRTIRIFPLPLADFSFPLVCYGNAVSFDNLSQLFPGDTMSTYQWNFPLGSPGTSQSFEPSVIFNSLDTSSVRLIATTIHGCRDTVTYPVVISATPIALFSVPDVCEGSVAQIDNLSTVQPAGSIVNYNWFAAGSDLSQSTLDEPAVSYGTAGIYPIDLVVQASGGCADTLRRNITIHPLPVAGFSVPAGCEENALQFTNTSTIVSGNQIQAFSWSLPGGNPSVSTVRNPVVRYDSSGTYDAALVATSVNGCRDTVQVPVVIHALPAIVFTDLDSACVPFCHPFAGNATSVDGVLTQWSWTFPGGNPANSDQENPGLICYDQPGIFGASLQVITEHGCVSDTQVAGIIKAYPLPVADFSISTVATGILNPDFTFMDNSSGNVVQWLWNFGDGSPSVLGGPQEHHSYAGSMVGNTFYRYETSLIVTSRYGCTDTIRRPIDITPDFTFYMPNAFTPNGDRRNGTFFGKSFGVTEYDIWIFDRWGLELWSCHHDGDNIPWDRYGEDGMSSACRWDGTFEGKRVQQDVYVWKVILTDVYGKKHSYLGHVTVLY
ncbi:MAG: PKD domain-containing protein, partial [Bacteroidota bacterium]